MALVAYSDDSDIGSDSEEVEQQVNGVQNDKNAKISPEKNDSDGHTEISPIASANVNSEQKSPSDSGLPSGIDDIVDEDENHYRDKTNILASIPEAVPIDSLQTAVGEVEDELTDVPTADRGKHHTILILFPGLVFIVFLFFQFAEDEEEEEPKEEPERKKVQPSNKGSGLFSFLPEPKHISVKETKRPLIPYVLTKPPPARKSPKPTQAKAKMAYDKKDTGPSDFFSLSESSLDAVAAVPLPPIATTMPEVQTKSYGETAKPNYENQINHVPVESMTSDQQRAESQYSFQPEDQSSEGPADIDQEAMIRLMGKRRGKGEEINFIDVSADDALLTRDEWMTKALSEEKPTHSYSKKKEGLPSQKQKQKHQITYLAHQAKERELELKNNWAQNRMTKMQTQAKYGF
ncbi:LOW QUALITY PROTEIN: proline-rich protein PRCC-like [Macrobrachium nipponense]|uniref:LOW QUALITY PROTEIN: proline-rich protein PRCC-like n=1 Tax=Macrobrachium nipponense TaxID=159736 RepID=UPI0030C8D2AD